MAGTTALYKLHLRPPARYSEDIDLVQTKAERNHQGLDNQLISGRPAIETMNCVRRRSRLGGLLNFYQASGVIIRSAAEWNITAFIERWSSVSIAGSSRPMGRRSPAPRDPAKRSSLRSST
jgi:Nucleotidyl transferase AbiEii toxin, Type IV TA system